MKKIMIRSGQGVAVVFLLLYAFVWVRANTSVPAHDTDLQLTQASIPAGSNAFDILQATGNDVWWPDQRSAEFLELARDTNWDENLASAVVASNHMALAAWDAAAKLPAFQAPMATQFADQLPYLHTWKELAQIAAIRENILLHHGHDKEAFDLIMSDLQMSRRMQDSHGVLICYLVAVAMGNIGLNQIQHWVGQTHLDTNQLKDYIQQLAVDPDAEAAAFAHTIGAEYHCQIGTLEALRDGTLKDPDDGTHYPRPSRLMPVFNFSKTKAEFAGTGLLLVKAAHHHFNETTLPDFESSRPGFLNTFFSGNLVGELMYEMTAPAMVPSLARKCQTDAAFQATRTILALRAWQLTHGHLPPDLASLVPEFLNQVPVDDFDGQPLRYSPERKIVYSVGKNLKDDGGDDSRGKPSHPPLDLVYHFDF